MLNIWDASTGMSPNLNTHVETQIGQEFVDIFILEYYNEEETESMGKVSGQAREEVTIMLFVCL